MNGPKRKSTRDRQFDEQLIDAAKRGDNIYLRSLLGRNYSMKILSEALAEALVNNQKKAANILYPKLQNDIRLVLKTLSDYRAKLGSEYTEELEQLYIDKLLSLVAHNNSQLNYEQLKALSISPGITKSYLNVFVPYFIGVANPPFTKEQKSNFGKNIKL